MRSLLRVLVLVVALTAAMLVAAAAIGMTGVVCGATAGCLPDPVPANCSPARAGMAVPIWVSEEKVIDGVTYWCAQL